MKNTIVAIFAHPDDEAFGPAGTIYKLSKDNDVYLISATRGQAGEVEGAPSKQEIGELREKELRQSAPTLGVKEVFFLDFEDGTLSNNLYHKLADAITAKLDELKPDTILTYEPRGVSGHLDHVAVSLVSTYVFYKRDYIKTLKYYCLSSEQSWTDGEYYIYFPPGYPASQIDEIVDVADVWDIKKHAMYAHSSQRKDADMILARYESIPKKEHFIIIQK